MKKKRKLTRAEIRHRNAIWALDPEGVKDLILERFPSVRGFVDRQQANWDPDFSEANCVMYGFGRFALEYIGPTHETYGDTARAREVFSLVETCLERGTPAVRRSFGCYFCAGFDREKMSYLSALEGLTGPLTHRLLRSYFYTSCET